MTETTEPKGSSASQPAEEPAQVKPAEGAASASADKPTPSAAKPATPTGAVKAAAPAAAKPAAPSPASASAAPKPPASSATAKSAAAGAAPKASAAAKEEAAPAAPTKGVTRREFLNYVWGASMALFLAQFAGITFFFAMPRFRPGEFGGEITVRADEFPEPNGTPVANNIGKFWLVNTDAGINALYRVCTHLGCLFPWSDAAQIFACPCHGSQFQLDGTYIAGPAPRDLDRFTFRILDADGNVLASSTDGKPVPMPSGANRVVVNTGQKILGKSHF